MSGSRSANFKSSMEVIKVMSPLGSSNLSFISNPVSPLHGAASDK